jgi:hypothetical protein
MILFDFIVLAAFNSNSFIIDYHELFIVAFIVVVFMLLMFFNYFVIQLVLYKLIKLTLEFTLLLMHFE